MIEKRRRFMTGLVATGAVLSRAEAIAAIPANAQSSRRPGPRIVELFNTLPGNRALHILSPAAGQDFEVRLNPTDRLFCGSAFKVLVLAEYLRMVDAGQASIKELLPVDSTVWSVGSPVLTPLPGTVTGQISARTALEAMIAHSDNTATDMMLKRVGPERVRAFMASTGLGDARIPDSTRQFFAYIAGDPQWQTITWERLLDLLKNDPYTPKPVLNDVQTMAISPSEFVSFYARALSGAFFANANTLNVFRAVLSQADAIPRVMPLGVNAFLKGGSIDFGGEYALCLAGGVFIPPVRWAYFGMTINWTDADGVTVAEGEARFAAVTSEIFALLKGALAHP